MPVGDLFLRLGPLNPFPFTATTCGHPTHRRGTVSAFGIATKARLPRNASGATDWCFDCLGKMAIRCAWCEESILPWEPITLGIPPDGFIAPDGAATHDDNGRRALVGCLRMGCAPTAALHAGFWIPGDDGNGRVHRMPSPIERLMAADQPSMVIVHDACDMHEAANPTVIPLPNDRNDTP